MDSFQSVEQASTRQDSVSIERSQAGSITARVAARIAKSKIAAIAACLAIVFTMALPQNASAFGYFYPDGARYPGPTIRYCIASNQPGWGTTATNTIKNAVEHWDGYMDRVAMDYVHPTSGNCQINIHIRSFSQMGNMGTDPGRGIPYAINGMISWSDVYLNADRGNEFWFYGADQNCFVPWCAKPLDLWTVTLHEVGHALGIGHNTVGDWPACNGGYYFTDTIEACPNDYYNVDIMWENAADGYRRWVQNDAAYALIALGYKW